MTTNAMRGEEERSLAAGMDSVNSASPSATHEGSSNVVRVAGRLTETDAIGPAKVNCVKGVELDAYSFGFDNWLQ
jgi:hypothetical protein